MNILNDKYAVFGGKFTILFFLLVLYFYLFKSIYFKMYLIKKSISKYLVRCKKK